MKAQARERRPGNVCLYVGIDVNRKRSQVAVVTEDGQVQFPAALLPFPGHTEHRPDKGDPRIGGACLRCLTIGQFSDRRFRRRDPHRQVSRNMIVPSHATSVAKFGCT